MSHLYSLSIQHYRGIKNLKVSFGNTKFVAIIGRGDSGKTTILKAISAVLSPNWNLSFNDWDFYNCETEEPIVIEAVVKDLPDELIKQGKYGLCMGFLKDGIITYNIEDIHEEEQDQYEKVLTIRLKVTDNLEPQWTVVHGPMLDQETEINSNDRAKLKMYQISDYIDNHFSFSKGSPLFSLFRQNLEDKNATEKKIIEMVRKSYKAIKNENVFEEFDGVKKTILEQAKGLGLNLNELSTLLEFKENAYSESNITLHSDNIPYRLHGKGSKRLLSIAIQKGLVDDGGIVLIDELEQGMEPDRSRNLARLLKQTKIGQVLVTTHSRSVLAEVAASSLFLLTNDQKVVTFEDNYGDQSVLRAQPEAFFARRIICCEGKTEFGIIRALDDHLQNNRGFGLAVQGVVYLNCKGEGASFAIAERLKNKGFTVCIFADNDIEDLEKKKNYVNAQGVKTVLCDKGKCIESMLFTYLPWEAVCSLVQCAVDNKNHQAIFDCIPFKDIDEIKSVSEEDAQRKAREELSMASNKGKWYKNIDAGEGVGKIWFDYLGDLEPNCGLKKEYDDLIKWLGNDIS